MGYDRALCDSILRIVATAGRYEALTTEEKIAVACLKDLSYIEATLETGPVVGGIARAVAERMTLDGWNYYNTLDSSVYLLSDEDVSDRRRAQDAQDAAQEGFRKLLISLSSGGIGVIFTVIGFMISRKIDYSWLLPGAMTSWMACLVVLLVSFLFSDKALSSYVDNIDKGNRLSGPSKVWQLLALLSVVLATVTFLVGLIFIAGFVWQMFSGFDTSSLSST